MPFFCSCAIAMWKIFVAVLDGTVDSDPVRLTTIQSIVVTILAATMSASLYLAVGVHFPNVWYQIFAALLIAAILAPIFLYPSYRTAHRLRVANAVIRTQAFTDQLTGLPNSFALSTELEERLARTEDERSLAIHFIDVAGMKQVNDTLGHETGDAVLQAVAARLRGAIGPADFAARYGGDEFCVVQEAVTVPSQTAEYAGRLREEICGSYLLDGDRIAINITVGTAIAPVHGETPGEIMKAADLALHHAKSRGTGHELFISQLAMAAGRRRTLEIGLGGALAKKQLSVHFQPIFQRRCPSRITVCEALLRWELSDGTTIAPSEFIPIAERTGAIVEIGEWVLREACQACLSWPQGMRVAVNVSPVQFFRDNLVDTVRSVLDETGLPPGRLELEITESVLIGDMGMVGAVLGELRHMGVRVVLDDFGSGYCGLNYLRHFTIDKIKVDKSIIDDACTSEKALNILRGVSNIAAEIGMTVTVEGVDTQEKATLLHRENFADEVQGFLYSRPVRAAVLQQVIQRHSLLACDDEH